jgi:hypothetical protein
MTLGSTQPVTEMSTRNISWGGGFKGGLPPSCADCLKIWELSLLEPSGPVKVCNGIALPFTGVEVVIMEFLCYSMH